MKNPHLVTKNFLDAEYETEYLPPKWCTILILTMIVAFVVVGFCILNFWTSKVDSLQGQLLHAQNLVEELEKENHYLETNNETLSKENATLKCEAYFYGD